MDRSPKCCASCKRTNWNDPNEAFTPEEIGLRRKIKGICDILSIITESLSSHFGWLSNKSAVGILSSELEIDKPQ